MEKEYLITVIIPVFNAETYLPNTINSIIKQNIGFENIELILVDDKSTDSSVEVMNRFASEYSNIHVICLDENSGYPGLVRNRGLEIATGEYIMFIDSDDEYEIDMCEQLYSTLLETNSDCAICKYNKINHYTDNLKESKYDEKTILNPVDALYNIESFVWNKIFKRKIIDKYNIKFVDDRIGEDTFFCIEYILKSKSIVFLDEYYGYKYFNRNDSFSTTNLRWNLDVINHYYEILDIFNQNKVNINLNRFFNPFINYSLFCTIQMNDNNWSSIFRILTEINLFEKKIGFYKNLGTHLVRFIDFFVRNNHITLATVIVLILNKCYHTKSIVILNRKLLKILRKIHIKVI